MPTSTDLVTDLPADFEVFGQAVDTSLADLKGGTTGQVLKKNTNTDMDFVWSADAAGMTNPMTTTGDTIYSSSGSTPARLGIGTANQILRVNSGATAPEWATVSSGGITLISEQVASANSAIDFNSIPGTYKQLLLVWSGIVHSDNASSFDIRLNNSSSVIYNVQFMSISNTTPTTSYYVGDNVGEYSFGRRSNDANIYRNANGFLTIDDYTSTTRAKPYESLHSFYNTDATTRNTFTTNGVFNSLTAVTSLNIYRSGGTGTFSNTTNTSIRLYGLS